MRRLSLVLLGIIFVLICEVPLSNAKEKEDLISDSAEGGKIAGSVDWEAIRVLDLETAQKIAIAGNPSLAAAGARVYQAMERVAQSKSSWWPRVDVSSSSSHVSLSDNEHERSLQTARAFDPQATINDPEDIYSVSITAGWIVFNGFKRWFANASARYGAEESSEALMDAKRLLISSVGFGYHSAQLARENIKIAKADEKFNQRQVREAEARYRVGTGSLSDILNFKVQVNSARSERIRFKREHEIAMYALAALLGVPGAAFPPDLELAWLEAETPEEVSLPEAGPLIAYAVDHRPDILQGKSSVKQAESTVGVARAGFFPTLTLSGAFEGGRTNSGRFESDDFGSSISLNLRYNLFAGGETRAQIREAKQRHKEEVKSFEDTRIRISAEVRNALAQLKSAQEELGLQRANALLVKQNRDLVEKEYQAGQGSLVRLNEAQRDLNTAKGRLVLARVGLRQAWLNLKTSTAQTLIP